MKQQAEAGSHAATANELGAIVTQLEWAKDVLEELIPFYNKSNSFLSRASGILFVWLEELNSQRDDLTEQWCRGDVRAVHVDDRPRAVHYLMYACGENRRVLVLHLSSTSDAASLPHIVHEPPDTVWKQAQTRLELEGW